MYSLNNSKLVILIQYSHYLTPENQLHTSPDCSASGADIGIPVRSMYADIFLGTTRANGIPGVEQNSPTLLPGTEKLKIQMC